MRDAFLVAIFVALVVASCAPATAPRSPANGRDAGLAYNLACEQALRGNTDAAVDWLRRAAERGFSGIHLASTDPDLAAIRDHADYPGIIAAVRANADRRLASFRRALAGSEPTIVLPPGHDPRRPAPLIVALHGSGGTGRGLAGFWVDAAADSGTILVAPDAGRHAGGGFEWRYVDESEWLVLDTIDRVAERYPIDRQRVVLTGFSQGANIALILGTRYPARFCGLIPIAGFYEPQTLEIRSTVTARPRIALVTGADDPSAGSYRRAARELEAAGYSTRLSVLPGVGHTLPPRHRALFARLLRFACDLRPDERSAVLEPS